MDGEVFGVLFLGFESHLGVVEAEEGVLGTWLVCSAAWKFPVILNLAWLGDVHGR